MPDKLYTVNLGRAPESAILPCMRPSRPLFAPWADQGFLPLAFRKPVASIFLSLVSLACLAQASAPDLAAPAQEEHPYVLHVYTDLLQIPALVLDWRGAPLTNLTAADFKMQLDAGPLFRPTAVHLETNEPLTLAMVLDASGEENFLLRELSNTPGHGFPGNMLPHDHISAYAVDCVVLKSNIDTAAEVATAHEGIEHLLTTPALHKPNAPTKTCRSSKHLLDAIGVAATALGKEPGRRAILVISDGYDNGSTTTFENLREFASGKSIAIFSLREPAFGGTSNAFRGSNGSRSFSPAGLASEANVLDTLVAFTGGTALSADSKHLAAELDHFIALLRSRYILQFPRPSNDAGGRHSLDVLVPRPGVTVRAAGIAVPLRDAALMHDPNTVPADTSKMPVLGTRKPPR